MIVPGSLWLLGATALQVASGVLFRPSTKLAFASQEQSASGPEGYSVRQGIEALRKLPEDSLEFRKEVERIYENWMLERRNQMLDKLKRELPSLSDTKALQEVLERHFGNCICDVDPVICRVYALSC